ncbi:MAG: STAS domain-containing protein [Spirochaetota bacterium]
MDIKLTSSNGKIVVKLGGHIYVDQSEELLNIFNEVIEKAPQEVVLDMQELKSITSSGIGKIVYLYRELNKKNGKVKIIGVNDTIMHIFKVVKLDKLVSIEPAG